MKLFYFIFLSLGLCWGGMCALYTYPSYPLTPSEISFKEAEKEFIPLNSRTENVTVQKGKRLFKFNCANCHNKNMKDDLTGPALKGVMLRWEGKEALLYDWIRNSPKVIQSGNAYAVEIFNKWNKIVMPPFLSLSAEDISAILNYIESL